MGRGGGLWNPDVQFLFERYCIVLSGRRQEWGLEILVLAGYLCEWPLDYLSTVKNDTKKTKTADLLAAQTKENAHLKCYGR